MAKINIEDLIEMLEVLNDEMEEIFPEESHAGYHIVTNPKFSGCFNGIYIKKIHYSNPATIIEWSDDTKTVCKCAEGDIYSPEAGLVICVLKKLIGGSQIHELLLQWLPRNGQTVRAISDLRKDFGR